MQEIQLANEAESCLMLGSRKIAWKSFRYNIELLERCKLGGHDPNEAANSVWRRLEGCVRHIFVITKRISNASPPALLNATRNTRCSDSRDRVYGLLSLCEESEMTLHPDYSSSASKIYRRMAVSHIRMQETLDILTCCELAPDQDGGPSWAPNLVKPRLCESIRVGVAWNSITVGGTVEIQGNRLRALGCSITSLTGLSALFTDNYTVAGEMLQELRKLILQEQIAGQYPSGGTMIDAIARTMCFGYDRPRVQGADMQRSLEVYDYRELSAALKTLLKQWKTWTEVSLPAWIIPAQRYLLHRRLFYTAAGYVGLCTQYAQEGDILVKLYGCVVPMIFRKNGAGGYQVVGEAYCDGLMNGETFLKDQTGMAECGNDKRSLLSAITKAWSSKTFSEDPRLLPLGEDWEWYSDHTDGSHPRFRNKKTGKLYSARTFDPRLTVEALEKRGVKFETFDIV